MEFAQKDPLFLLLLFISLTFSSSVLSKSTPYDENLDSDVVAATFNIDLKKWVCPARPQNHKSESQGKLSSLARSILQENESPKPGSMFSLSTAMILGKESNESNFKALLTQLTGLNLSQTVEKPQEEHPHFSPKISMGTMGVSGPRRRLPRGRSTHDNNIDENVNVGRSRNNATESIDYAEHALCKPELRTIELNGSSDPNIFLYPTCVRVERCGGCCNHPLLQCQPTEIEMKKMKRIKTTFQGATYEHKGEVLVEVERHKACQCGCRIKEHDCNDRQFYVSNLCRCDCKDKNQEAICKLKRQERFWDPTRCECKCKNELECSTGLRFDPNTCRCTSSPPWNF